MMGLGSTLFFQCPVNHDGYIRVKELGEAAHIEDFIRVKELGRLHILWTGTL